MKYTNECLRSIEEYKRIRTLRNLASKNSDFVRRDVYEEEMHYWMDDIKFAIQRGYITQTAAKTLLNK